MAVISSIVSSSISPPIGRWVIRAIPAAIVIRGRVVPPNGIIVSNTKAIGRASTIEPWIRVRRIVIIEPVGIAGIPIVLISVLITAFSGILFAIGLLIRGVPIALHSAQLRIAPGKEQHRRQQKERNRFSYQMHLHSMPPVG